MTKTGEPEPKVLNEQNLGEIRTVISQKQAKKDYDGPELMVAYDDESEISPVCLFKSDLLIR